MFNERRKELNDFRKKTQDEKLGGIIICGLFAAGIYLVGKATGRAEGRIEERENTLDCLSDVMDELTDESKA